MGKKSSKKNVTIDIDFGLVINIPQPLNFFFLVRIHTHTRTHTHTTRSYRVCVISERASESASKNLGYVNRIGSSQIHLYTHIHTRALTHHLITPFVRSFQFRLNWMLKKVFACVYVFVKNRRIGLCVCVHALRFLYIKMWFHRVHTIVNIFGGIYRVHYRRVYYING